MTDPSKPRPDPFGSRRRLRERLPAFLEPDEPIRSFLTAFRKDPRKFNPLWVGVSVVWIGLWNTGQHALAIVATPFILVPLGWLAQRDAPHTAIVATDRALVLVETTGLDGARPQRVLARLPRTTKIGPLSRSITKVDLGGIDLWVPKGHAAEVELIDAEAEDPLPGSPDRSP